MSIEYLDNYREPRYVDMLARRIASVSEGLGRPVRLMEVCGGHTMAIHRFGIPSLMPPGIELTTGPGCPVCVTPPAYIDAALEWGETSGGIITTFGDLYRVPGSAESLEDAAARGLEVRVVYSPFDALQIARATPDREVVFLAIGFETTAPAVAATLEMARREGGAASRFRVMSAHKTMPRALQALVAAEEVAIDGLILPGHVSTIIGSGPYRFLAEDHGVPCCITGFEPVDILQGILSLLQQCVRGTPVVENRYGRAVRDKGNPKALDMMRRCFEVVDSQWRGLGCIGGSGLDLREELADFRAPCPDPREASAAMDRGCSCGEVLRGVLAPPQCPLFAGACTPETPAGPCMISSEGACAAHYRYQSA